MPGNQISAKDAGVTVACLCTAQTRLRTQAIAPVLPGTEGVSGCQGGQAATAVSGREGSRKPPQPMGRGMSCLKSRHMGCPGGAHMAGSEGTGGEGST